MDELSQVDKLLDDYDGESAYAVLQKTSLPADSAELLYRLAHACYIRSNQMTDESERIKLLREGREYALKSMEQDPENGVVWKWAATLTGVLAEHANLKEKISLGTEFKSYLDKAIEKLPDEAVLLHMRGRFIFQLSAFNMFERAFITMCFQELPVATYEMALDDLLKMEELSPGDLDNQLYIGKVYYAMGNYEMARKWFQIVCDSEALDAVDQDNIDEATALMKKLPAAKKNSEG